MIPVRSPLPFLATDVACPSRQFAVPLQFSCFESEADIQWGASADRQNGGSPNRRSASVL